MSDEVRPWGPLGASSRRSHNETTRPPILSVQLRALPLEIRLIAPYIDAHLWSCWAIYATACIAEGQDPEERHEDRTQRMLRKRWGANDQHGVYRAAGLSEKQAQVAFLHFDRQMKAKEISRHLNRPIGTVDRQLYEALIRLRGLNEDPVAA